MQLHCKKDFYMENGELAFQAGKDYIIKDKIFDEWLECIVVSEVSSDHIMPIDDEINEYFEVIE